METESKKEQCEQKLDEGWMKARITTKLSHNNFIETQSAIQIKSDNSYKSSVPADSSWFSSMLKTYCVFQQEECPFLV